VDLIVEIESRMIMYQSTFYILPTLNLNLFFCAECAINLLLNPNEDAINCYFRYIIIQIVRSDLVVKSWYLGRTSFSVVSAWSLQYLFEIELMRKAKLMESKTQLLEFRQLMSSCSLRLAVERKYRLDKSFNVPGAQEFFKMCLETPLVDLRVAGALKYANKLQTC
jgi:hypothetical protein